MPYYVYMLTNRRKTALYTGVTGKLESRIWHHKQHLIDGFTKRYNVDRLVYFEEYTNVVDAIAREKQIKGWTRAKKNALVATLNPGWNDLAEEWFRT